MGNNDQIIAAGRVILASASPRRLEMMEGLISPLEVIPSGVEENGREGEGPAEHVERLAAAKALAVAQDNQEAWVIGADTIVYIDGKILGKPRNPEEALEMLTRLSGRTHRVYTGYLVVNLFLGKKRGKVVESSVTFRPLKPEEREWYLKTAEPYDKAGAYAVQGQSSFFIRRIQGSYTNVMGLPMCELVDSLQEVGAISFPGRKGYR
jgi:septum formation protein